MDEQVNSVALAIRAGIIQTTNTPGWAYIDKFAERTVMDMERKAIDEEDEVRGSALRREAKAARAFLNGFRKRIELAKQYNGDPEPDNFLDIAVE